jgi:hypothetical protein
MDQENVLLVHNGILLSHEENETLSFAGKWMGTGEHHSE